MKDINNKATHRMVWLLFTGVLAIVGGCTQQVEPNLREEEVLKTLEEMRLAQDMGVSEARLVELGKQYVVDIRLAEHDANINPGFIASAKMTMKYYVECFKAKSQKDSVESFLENPPDTSVYRASEYNVRHILLKTQEETAEIIKQLDGGEDFEALARDKSTGQSGKNGGKLGWFAPGQMAKPFYDATAQLEKGTYTREPVHTRFGWHVILLEDLRPSETLAEDIRRSEKAKALINSSRKDLEKLPGVITELCGKGDANLEKTHELRGG